MDFVSDEKSDMLNLFAIAEERRKTWFETYQLAPTTAVSQVISTKRMREKIAQKPVSSDILVLGKQPLSKKPKVKLPCSSWKIKHTRKRAITPKERENLQNRWLAWACWTKSSISFLLTFNKVDSAQISMRNMP